MGYSISKLKSDAEGARNGLIELLDEIKGIVAAGDTDSAFEKLQEATTVVMALNLVQHLED